MDLRRTESPVYSRQWSGGSSSTGSSSPVGSPAHPRSRLPPVAGAVGMSSIKRTQTVAAKAAAQRLAQVMASQATDDDVEEEDDDDLGFRFAGASTGASALTKNSVNGNGNRGFATQPTPSLAKPNRAPSPALGRNFMDHAPPVRSTSVGRSSVSVRSSTTVVPQSRSSLRTPVAIPPIEPANNKSREKRFLRDVSQIDLKGSGNQEEADQLQDEVEMLREENDVIQDKLRHAEEKREEAEARARELEKQVASLGEGVSLEAKLLTRKEAAIRQREAALKAALQTKDGRDEEVLALRKEIQTLKEDTETVMERLEDTKSEVKSLRRMTQRMILTHEEMEEVVLKRCWLARYWGLGVRYGICADIAVLKHEHWSSLAPLPFEVVISAGQKAREESWDEDTDRSKVDPGSLSDLSGEGNIETMLSVEMGLRELASLKVEDAVILALAQSRRPNLVRQSDPKSVGDSKYLEAFELSQEESEDVLFKEAWLTYFWRRAKVHGVEDDVAEERLKYWISRSTQTPTSHDAVDVERGIVELRKLGIEQQLWEASRRETDHQSYLAAEAATSKSSRDSDNTSS